MKEFQYTIKDPAGIHARPAGLFVKQASQYDAGIEIKKGDKQVSAKGIFGVMGLGVKSGETITVRIEGTDEEKAFTELKAFLEANL